MHDRRAPKDRPPRDDSAFAPVTVAGRGSPILPTMVLIVAFAAIVAFVKPWGSGAAGPTPLVQAPATPTPIAGSSLSPSPDDHEIGAMCIGTNAWLVASEEKISGRAVHVWRAMNPVVAVQPDDPAIPWVPITSESLDALGWCGPEVGDGILADPTTVQAWVLAPTGIRPVALRRLRPTLGASNMGGLYSPAFAPTRRDPTVAWPAGRYLFRVRSGDGREVTFGVEVEVAPAAHSSAVP